MVPLSIARSPPRRADRPPRRSSRARPGDTCPSCASLHANGSSPRQPHVQRGLEHVEIFAERRAEVAHPIVRAGKTLEVVDDRRQAVALEQEVHRQERSRVHRGTVLLAGTYPLWERDQLTETGRRRSTAAEVALAC